MRVLNTQGDSCANSCMKLNMFDSCNCNRSVQMVGTTARADDCIMYSVCATVGMNIGKTGRDDDRLVYSPYKGEILVVRLVQHSRLFRYGQWHDKRNQHYSISIQDQSMLGPMHIMGSVPKPSMCWFYMMNIDDFGTEPKICISSFVWLLCSADLQFVKLLANFWLYMLKCSFSRIQ